MFLNTVIFGKIVRKKLPLVKKNSLLNLDKWYILKTDKIDLSKMFYKIHKAQIEANS